MMFCALTLGTDRCGMYIGQTVRIHWCNQSSWPPRLPMMPGWQMVFARPSNSDRCFCSIKPCCRAKFWVSRCGVLTWAAWLLRISTFWTDLEHPEERRRPVLLGAGNYGTVRKIGGAAVFQLFWNVCCLKFLLLFQHRGSLESRRTVGKRWNARQPS